MSEKLGIWEREKEDGLRGELGNGSSGNTLPQPCSLGIPYSWVMGHRLALCLPYTPFHSGLLALQKNPIQYLQGVAGMCLKCYFQFLDQCLTYMSKSTQSPLILTVMCNFCVHLHNSDRLETSKAMAPRTEQSGQS